MKQCTLCHKATHGFSQYCNKHLHALLRYGSPTGKRVLRKDLYSWERIVARLVAANRDHPAIVIVFEELSTILAQGARRAASNPHPQPHDWTGRLNCELARLHGVTGEQVFIAVATIHFYARAFPDILQPTSRAMKFAMARAVLGLRCRDRFSGWREGKRWSGWVERKTTRRFSTRALDALGQHLAVSLVHVLRTLEDAYDRLLSAPQARQQKLVDALQQPFT
jgi:hypothetical protein